MARRNSKRRVLSQSSRPKFLSGRPMAIGLTASLFVVVTAIWWRSSSISQSSDELLKQARLERSLNHHAAAESLALKALKRDPQLYPAALLAAESAESQKNWSRAEKYYSLVATANPEVRVSVELRKAKVFLQQQYSFLKAEQAYRSALEIDPDNVDANMGLMELLARCGRKREVTPQAIRLIRQTNRTEPLFLLARTNADVKDVELLKKAHLANPSDPNPAVGLAWNLLRDSHAEEAESLLKLAIRNDPPNVPARLLMGRLYLYKNRAADFAEWAASLPPAANDFAETWLLRGQMAEIVGDGPGAIRCYWETVRLGPESKLAAFRLAQGLSLVGLTQEADVFHKTIPAKFDLEETQNHLMYAADRDLSRPEFVLKLAQAYEAAGRIWEAYGWSKFATTLGKGSAEATTQTKRLQQRLQNEPFKQVTDSANMALSINLSRYPIPDLHVKSASTSTDSEPEVELTFRDDAQRIGLKFEYFSGVQGPPTHRMFEFTGGGVASLDFDSDWYPDLFLTQGCHWPPGSPDQSGGDRLFRNRSGVAFDDITASARIREVDFGQGATAGDFNADGFPDVYVANIGQNRLWQNQGDGTFRDVTNVSNMVEQDWTTSVVMVDLTGDGLPDIYSATYSGDKDVFDRVCRSGDGSPAVCSPTDFQPQADRLWKNLGDGHFQEATADLLGEIPMGTGLGVAVWDPDGDGRLSLFVANDMRPNFFFRAISKEGNSIHYRESAVEAGVALNGEGKATGSMGVAVGDIDGDSRMDFLIANFYNEPNTLFLNKVPGLFEDWTRRFGLHEPSLPMVGFGAQFLDVDLDGKLELFVANGHLSEMNRSSKMSPQLFRLSGNRDRFVELPMKQLGPYFEKKWLGRAAAKIDWNRDGREDLIVGHVNDPVALLTNSTATPCHSLSIRLIGVQSNRDAIGTSVSVRQGSRTTTYQLTAGDGYQCSNERRLAIGVGQSRQIDDLTIKWPSGTLQHLVDVVVPAEFCVREGQAPLASSSVSP